MRSYYSWRADPIHPFCGCPEPHADGIGQCTVCRGIELGGLTGRARDLAVDRGLISADEYVRRATAVRRGRVPTVATAVPNVSSAVPAGAGADEGTVIGAAEGTADAPAPPTSAAPTDRVVDLMAALEESVAEAKAARVRHRAAQT